MSSLRTEMVFLVLQFLDEEKFNESVHKLEKESGVFFNMKYFEKKVKAGEWEEVEKYLAGFTKLDDNRNSTRIFFEIRKQKYLEALDRKDKAKGLEILETELKVFSTFNAALYQGMTQLLTLGNFREKEQLSNYGDTETARSRMLIDLKKLMQANPLFHDKLVFPNLKSSGLRTLINQSLNPDIKTLFTDHSCTPTNGPAAAAAVAANAGAGANAASANAGAGASSVQASVVIASSMPVLKNQVSGLKHPRTPPATPGMVDYQSPDHEQSLKRLRPAPSVEENAVDPSSRNMEKPRTMDDVNVIEKTKPCQLAKIAESGQCRLLNLRDRTRSSSKVVRLLYTNSGVGILALGSSGIQKLWKWKCNDQNIIEKLWKWQRQYQNPSRKATASVAPPPCRLMTNDISGVNLEEAVPCIALSKNDKYVMSATGGKVSMFNMMTFKVMTTVMPPPPTSTFLAFHPQDDNIIAIGMEDSTIHIYNVRVKKVKSKLKCHHKRITGLAFSSNLNILVSSSADAQLSVWSIDTWEKRESVAIQIPVGKAPNGDTRVHFHSDQIRMLVVHETQLAIYDASKMKRIRQWVPQDVLSAPISCATYSCDSQLVYATFCDGNIGVFDADTLRLRCHIAPTAYLSQAVLNGSQAVYPLVVAAHPLESNQFAVGLTDGTVKVLEPLEPEEKWGVSPPGDSGMLNSRTTSSSTSKHTRDDGKVDKDLRTYVRRKFRKDN